MFERDAVEGAVREMNGALRKSYEKICSLFAEGRAYDARARWKAAAEIRAVREGEARYGARAITKLSRALGRDEATLYKYIAVATRWSETEFAKLLERATVYGGPLSFSHFVEIAPVEPDERRDALLERAFTDGLSVRELARLARDPSDGEAESRETRALRASLSDLVTRARRMHEQLISCSSVLRRLEDEGDQPELDDILESAVEAHKALHVEGALALRRLESALEKRKLRRRGALRPTAGSHPRHDLA